MCHQKCWYIEGQFLCEIFIFWSPQLGHSGGNEDLTTWEEHMWPETLPAGCFANGWNSPKILHLVAFHVNSTAPCHIPTSSQSTASNYRRKFHRPELLGETACRWTQTILSRAISFLATALSAISSCYLLSLAIWRYLPPPGSSSSPLSVPCLQLPPNWDCASTPCHLQSLALGAYDNSLPKENLLVRKRLNLACLLLTSLSFYIVSKPNQSVL